MEKNGKRNSIIAFGGKKMEIVRFFLPSVADPKKTKIESGSFFIPKVLNTYKTYVYICRI